MKMKKLMVAALAAAITVGSVLPASAAWVQSGSDWRYQNEDGSWQANKWFQEDGKWYHFDANSNAQKGWFKDTDGKWYFFAYNGIMQTGLLKVDDKVYYMNADGSLFSGAMKIGGVEYNFTEYGTTNGKPSVGASQTFGGNGNQTNVVVGGGGYSRSGGGSGNSGPISNVTKENVQKAVVAAVEENKQNEFVSTTITGQNITVTVKAEQTESTLKEVIGEAESVLSGILDTDGVESVQFGNTTITVDDNIKDKIKAAAIKEGLTPDTLLGSVEKTYKITVALSDGQQSIDYTFSVKK